MAFVDKFDAHPSGVTMIDFEGRNSLLVTLVNLKSKIERAYNYWPSLKVEMAKLFDLTRTSDNEWASLVSYDVLRELESMLRGKRPELTLQMWQMAYQHFKDKDISILSHEIEIIDRLDMDTAAVFFIMALANTDEELQTSYVTFATKNHKQRIMIAIDREPKKQPNRAIIWIDIGDNFTVSGSMIAFDIIPETIASAVAGKQVDEIINDPHVNGLGVHFIKADVNSVETLGQITGYGAILISDFCKQKMKALQTKD